MPSIDIPTLGTLAICAALVCTAYTIAVSLAAAGGRPHLLRSARFGTFATILMVATAVFLLAYAFQAHDFRIRYVARYSDRSMSATYLWTALWGGQDGSLLWWSFLLSGYVGAFTLYIRRKHQELQPYIFATAMSVLGFFLITMLFAANPFATTHGAAPPDGEGLNPLLQNYWMVIHPPSLYMGMTGWTVPFAIVVAALITGRLGDEWIHLARRWVLLAWGFLTLGNILGMFWSYEELGWGGYWAWDPVENASFMPWLTGTAYLHSVMIQERRGMLKVWNVFLLTMTFILTIFGTFLTRSGLIASVHSFARSDIGIYFGVYLIILVSSVFLLIAWRLPDLRGRAINAFDGVVGVLLFGIGAVLIALAKVVEVIRRPKFPKAAPKAQIESLLSREFAFLLNNWILLGMLVFVMLATTFPLLSEWIRGETVTVGPGYYNKWMVPLGLILLFLSGVGPLISWRKATGRNLLLAFRWPALTALAVFCVHAAAGNAFGFPPFVEWDDIYDTTTGQVLAAIYSVAPVASTTLGAFVFATVAQEYARGVAVRRRTKKEGVFTALVQLVSRARRRYGGYLVHVGIVLMFLGFTGAAYDVEREATLRPGERMEIGGYEARFDRVRTEQDRNKRMLFADVSLFRGERSLGQVSPAKFVYRTHPNMPTTEVAIRTGPLHDVYVILSTVDMETSRATFRIIKRPLVLWIWIGGLLMLLGVAVAISPTLREVLGEARSGAPSRAAGAAATLLLALLLSGGLGLTPTAVRAQSDSTSSLHAGTVEIQDPQERQVFERLLCECGDCQRLPLSTCGCGWAENMRAELRAKMARGDSLADIVSTYRERWGPQSIAIPADEGLDRALWAVPIVAILFAAGALVWRARQWVRPSQHEESEPAADDDGYDARLEEELDALERD